MLTRIVICFVLAVVVFGVLDLVESRLRRNARKAKGLKASREAA